MPSLIVTPNFPMEKAFHIRNLQNSIADKIARIEAMRASLKQQDVRVDIEHVMAGGEELLLLSAEGREGVAVSLDDIESGAITLQQACDELLMARA